MIECLLLDTETTGMAADDEVIELAYIELPTLAELKKLSPIYGREFPTECRQFYPDKDIHPAAQAVHGKSKNSLKGNPRFCPSVVPKAKILLGHGVSFDYRMIKANGIPTICTLSLAKRLWKKGEVSGHKLTTLITEIIPNGKDLIVEAHGAMADCFLTLILLDEILKLMPDVACWEDLSSVPIAKAPSTQKVGVSIMPFGEHKGKPVKDIPVKYLQWLLTIKLQPGLKKSVENALADKSPAANRFR